MTTFRRAVPFALAALVVAAAVATIAGAGPNTLQDGNDTRGALDVKTVRWSQAKAEPPAWKIVTFDRWTAARIWDRGYLYVFVDTLGGEPADYAAQIRSTGSGIAGILFKLGKGPNDRDVVVTSLTVRKPGAAAVTVKIPLKRMRFDPSRTFYRWWTATTLSGEKCPSLCVDRAPNSGSVLHYRPGMSPTPSPTSSPSPSP
ncbi:MAG TPA: hypothetical protein VLA82_02805 [Actinomycetota bacterium]|nr:hypothetical protein [Actinomycetota bacterium]